MEYLSAIGPLLILILFGGGLVIVAYLAIDDMRIRGVSWNAGSLSATVTSAVNRLKALPIETAIVTTAVLAGAIVVYMAAGSFGPAPTTTEAAASASEAAAPAAAPEPAKEAAKEPAKAAAAAPPPAAPAPKPAAEQASNAMASMSAANGAVRTVTASNCASTGCPVTCGADEVLASAYCISGGTARLTDQLQVKDGVVTAKCSPNASSISVACARK